MNKALVLLIIFGLVWIGKGLNSRNQRHNLMNGRLGLGKFHQLRNDGKQHNVLSLQEDQDTYEEQTTPQDGQTSSTSANLQKQNIGSSSLASNKILRNHKLFGDDDSTTTGDGFGYHKMQQKEIKMQNIKERSELSSYDHYYGNQGHKMLQNRQHNQRIPQGEGNLRDQYSMQDQKMVDKNTYHNLGAKNTNKNHKSKLRQTSHKLKNQKHFQNDLDEPNNGQRTYYVDDELLKQGLRDQDTSSVKTRDYIDYNKELTPTQKTATTTSTMSSYNDISHNQAVTGDLKQRDTDESATSSQSIELHDPNNDAYLLSNKVRAKEQNENHLATEQFVREVKDKSGNARHQQAINKVTNEAHEEQNSRSSNDENKAGAMKSGGAMGVSKTQDGLDNDANIGNEGDDRLKDGNDEQEYHLGSAQGKESGVTSPNAIADDKYTDQRLNMQGSTSWKQHKWRYEHQ